MKVAVCCIGRTENLYIREYCEHYQNIGVDTIFIFDNNYDGEEHFEDVIQDYIDSGFVKLIDFRNKSYCQLEAYQYCSNTYGPEYDWMLFIDCGDEYLYMENFGNIKDFLSQEKYNNFDVIYINVLTYGDNDLVYYDGRKLKDRFIEPLPLDKKIHFKFPENNHSSSIVRCNKQLLWSDTPHSPNNVNLKYCNVNGTEVKYGILQKYYYNGAHFKHYTTKTIEEWLNIKVKRGYPDYNKNCLSFNYINEFFKFNKPTNEKLAYIKNWITENNII